MTLTGAPAVRKAIESLRRGLPVAVADDVGSGTLILAAEAATETGIARFIAAAVDDPILAVTPTRGVAITSGEERATAFMLAPALLHPETLRALADPTLPPSPPPPVTVAPPAAGLALALVKLAHLLPACLVASVRPGAADLVVAPAEVVGYATSLSAGLRRIAEAAVPLAEAPDARIIAFRPPDGGIEHLAILVGRPEQVEAPLVRVHSECFTGDLLGSLRCDCGPQLRGAIARMAQEGAGALIYLAQEGRGIGLANKLRAYTLQDRGLDTVDANRALGWEVDERNFLAASVMLRALGIARVRLLTNNPQKVAALSGYGIEVAARVSLVFASNGVNDGYLAAKAARLGHWLDG